MKFTDHIGLDIGSESIKLVQVTPTNNNKFKLLTLGRVQTSDKDNLENIKRLIKEAKVRSKQAVIGLAESMVYTRIIEMPALTPAEMEQAIKWQAEQYIPVPLSEVVLKYQVLSNSTDLAKSTVLLVAAPNNLLSQCMALVNGAGLEVVGIETEALAIIRSVVTSEDAPPTLILNFGASGSVIMVAAGTELILTQCVSTGGIAISRALASELKLELAQAEEYKSAYGLEKDKLEGRVAKVISPVVDIVCSEIKRAMAYYDTRWVSKPIRRIVVTGGSSLLPGLVEYFSAQFGIEVQMGDPFAKISLDESQQKAVTQLSSSFAVAVGLALKPI